MSAWSDRLGGKSTGATTGSSEYQSGGAWSQSGAVKAYQPKPVSYAPPEPASDEKPGVVSINPLDPAKVVQSDGISQLFDGLRQALVGPNEGRDAPGFKDASSVGNLPIAGTVGRVLASGIGGLGEVAGAVLNTVGGGLERVPAGNSYKQNEKGELVPAGEALDEAYAAIADTPEGAEFRKQYEEAIAKEKGLLDTGLLDNDAHFKSLAVRKWAEEESYKQPSLAPGAFTTPGTMADSVMNMFDSLGVGATAAARGWAELETPGQGWRDRLDLILAVGDGEVGFNEDKGVLNTGILAGDPTTGLNDMERLVYTKVRAKDWTPDQARDFLASNGQAFGHSAVANIGGSLALDPLNFATAGAGAIAKFGARGAIMASRLAKAESTLAILERNLVGAETALKVARARPAAVALGRGTREVRQAGKALKVAREAKVAKTAEIEQLKQFLAPDPTGVRKINVLARTAEGSEKLGAAFRLAGRGYAGLGGTSIGKAAKITRTLIDPLHAIDLHMPGAMRAADLYSDSLPRSVASTMGVHHYKRILDEALRLDPTRGLFNQITKDFAVATTNMGREGIIELYRSTQIAGELGEDLMKTLPDDVMKTAVESTKHRDLERWLRFNTVRHVQIDHWDDVANKTLAKQLDQTYARTDGGWLKAMDKMTKEEKSLYKFIAYGNSNRELLNFVDRMTPEAEALLPFPKRRMVLLAKSTLTRVGGETLLTALSKNLTRSQKLAIIDKWQQKYSSLRYVHIDPSNQGRSIDLFIQDLKDNMDRLPMQVIDDDLKKLGSDADALVGSIGEYRIGFRPDDEFLWGLERDNGTGLYKPAGNAWADHVADGALPYRPASALRLNIAGHPIVGVPVLRAGVRMVDHLDSAARLMKSQVSSAMVGEAARKRFIAKAAGGELAAHGLTERVAQDWWEHIQSYVREHQGYSGPRGMGGEELYRALKKERLIPKPLLNGERVLNPDDVMRFVLEAYDGDLRYIGLTQKLSGRAKRMLFEVSGGSNWAGQIAEHAWPTLKFRYNPIFQLQEKIEPWVLNAQRGVSFATGVNMSEADRVTEGLLTRMTNNSLVRQSDIDNFEYSSAVLFSKSYTATASKEGSALSKMKKLGSSLTDVQGMKRVNMLRTFRKGLGRELKSSWDEARPGDWDKMKEAADIAAGRILSEDDFALQIISQNAFANDIFVNRVVGKAGQYTQKADWANAIKTGVWHSPTALGELKALDLDHVAASLRLTNGRGEDITDLNMLRQSLATDQGTMGHVIDGLSRLGASKDYIRRVQHGLDFSWNTFWKQASERFSLTTAESAGLQTMMAEAAKLRDMTPVEFMSQVFSPSLIDGTEGVLGHLEGTVRVLREARAAGRKITPSEAKLAETRTQIAGVAGVSTRDDLVRQLAKTFSAHLDPSARRALLLEFDPVLRDAVNSGAIKLDLQEVDELWDSLAENKLADRILGYMDGKRGSAAHTVLGDEARGVASARKGARQYMETRGVTPHDDSRLYAGDDDLAARTAVAHGAMGDTPFEATGHRPTSAQVRASSTDLKPRPATVDERTYNAYQDMAIDSRAQFDHMTAPQKKGGMGIKLIVSKKEQPYADAKAMAADVKKGQIRVYGGGSDHALMTNDQVVMFRAVHDVFGRSAEGFDLGAVGDLNAAVTHAQMYSDTGRAAMLTETYGKSSYANFSTDAFDVSTGAPPVRHYLDPADPASDFEKQHPFDPNADVARMKADPNFPQHALPGNKVFFSGKDAAGNDILKRYEYTQTVGDGMRMYHRQTQRAILQAIHEMMQEFPNLRIKHVDVLSFREPLDVIGKDTIASMGYHDIVNGQKVVGASALTWAGDADESVIIFDKDFLDNMGPPPWNNLFAGREASRNELQVYDSFSGTYIDRRSNLGAPRTSTPYSPEYLARHEAAHAFDTARRPRQTVHVAGTVDDFEDIYVARKGAESYAKMMARFEKTGASMDLSEYGMSNTHEFGAELIAFVTDPGYAKAVARAPEALRDMAEEMRKHLIDSKEWTPLAAGADPATILDTLPRPDFVKGHRFVRVGPSGMKSTGDWGSGGVYMSPRADAVEGGSGAVSAYEIFNDEMLDLTLLTPEVTVRDAIRAHTGGGYMTEDMNALGGFVEDLGLTLDSTGEDVRQFAIQHPKAFNTVLKDHEYKGFEFEGAGYTGGTVITDPTALRKLAHDVHAPRNPGPAQAPRPMTVAEANRAKPGSAGAPQKVGLLPQDVLDEIGGKFIGQGKHVESNPDVARTAQMFGKWTDAVVANGLLRGEHGVYSQVLRDAAKLPTGAAVPYNYTEGAIANLAYQNMIRKWDDAFRLQYFAQERTFLERSINHPMFGMYPASYMWGKIMPEMIRFLAAEPFGNKTGGLLYSALDVQASIAMRREFDPYFDANIEELGHSQALSFGGYLLPTLPWDIGASAPGWMRSISGQGTADAKLAAQGQPTKGLSLVDPAVDAFKKLAPLTTTIPWAGRAFDEVNGPASDKEVLKDAADLHKAVKASELQPTMQRIMQELQEALK